MPEEVTVRRLETTKLVHEMTGSFYDSLRILRAQNKGAAWVIGQLPFEIFVAMDIPFIQWENFAVRAAARKADRQFKKIAESHGFSPDVCSYARISSGCTFFDESNPSLAENPELLMPKADFIVMASTCPSMCYWFEVTRRFFKVPNFAIDVPALYNPYDSAAYAKCVDYVESQLVQYVRFLEEVTGRRLDWDRLREVMTMIKKCAELRKEVLELAKNVPAPMNFFDALITMAPINILRGRPDTVTYFEKLKREVEDRVAQGIGTIPNERFRLYWDHLGIWYKVGELSKKFASYGAVVLVGWYTNAVLYDLPERIDLNRPLRSMADLLYMRVMGRLCSIQCRTDDIVKMIDDFKLDGVIMHSSRTCRPIDLGQPDVIEEVRQRTGVPGLLLEADHCDPSFYDESYVNSSLDSFFEVLEARKAALR